MDDYQQHLEQYQPTDELIATLLDQLPPLEPDTSPIPFDVPFFFMSPEYQNSPLGSTSSFSPHTPYSPLSSQIASDVQANCILNHFCQWPGYEQFGTVTQLKPPKNGEKRETRSEVLAHVAKQVARFMRKSKNYMKLPMKLDDTWLIGPYTTPESVIIERIRRIPGGSTAWDFEPAPLRLS
ncbi:hypothetical protein EUX98_g8035 [Antrodiella citrinella]|uniref:Uncharacterized protein n=1 Tax=Antrodiella citrinella TaxID=2447956 RepID=A0A4S4ME33_9APHY|nr:hypothetical protein EUX98_g8035 [Antrodiella citrinella]